MYCDIKCPVLKLLCGEPFFSTIYFLNSHAPKGGIIQKALAADELDKFSFYVGCMYLAASLKHGAGEALKFNPHSLPLSRLD